MSRSYKKSPYMNNACTRNRKDDRIENNRTRRHKEKEILKNFDPEEDIFPTANEISTPWDWGCDGWKRFDPDRLEERGYPYYKSMGK